MKYFAEDLQSVYEILEMLPKPLAVIDFASKVVGHEVRVAQSMAAQFYDKHCNEAHVAALCWRGASILYSNVSDDQIEFADKEVSMLGNRRRRFQKKREWLHDRGHQGNLAAIVGIVVRYDPHNEEERAIRKKLGGFVFFGSHWKMIGDRLSRTQHVFSTGEPPPVQKPYIAIYDRNERLQPERNTREWHVKLFRRWARRFGFKLVVISDFYPREWKGVTRIPFADRNLARLCNAVHHSALYAAPSCGCGAAGLIFGCNFVSLGEWSDRAANLLPGAIGGRGFCFLGSLDAPDGEVENRVREYLKGIKG